MSKRKFCNKSEMPENIIGYEYSEDTEFPYLKRVTRVDRGTKTKSWFFCEPTFEKVEGDKTSLNFTKFNENQ